MWRPAFSCPLGFRNKILFPLGSALRSFSAKGSPPCQLIATQLASRSLVRVVGSDRGAFLQGLITNDVGHVESPGGSIYTLLLNHQGRVLFDAILYAQGQDSTLLDCHVSLRDKLIRHLKLFRVKRAVDVTPAEDLTVWSIYHERTASKSPGIEAAPSFKEEDSCCAPTSRHSASSQTSRDDLPFDLPNESLAFGDPRLPQLGWRVLLPPGAKPPKDLRISEEVDYQELRYSLGVGEGPLELLSGNSFPLESNGDYLHGISFQKGCYVGQELTARTHHTGVVRKRLMPFRLEEAINPISPEDLQNLQILNEKNRPVGKVRGIQGQFGIGLIRVEEALGSSNLTLKGDPLKGDGVPVTISRPSWWPIQLSKEIHSGSRK